jgi:hypothetical protein
MESHITDITKVIQLAVAPVFLLTAISTLITALNNRLGGIIDRRRIVQDRLLNSREKLGASESELQQLSRRARLIYFAIFSAVLAALMICLVVAGAFLGALLSIEIARIVAIFFIFAMVALIACLSMFLREVYLAVTAGTHRLP